MDKIGISQVDLTWFDPSKMESTSRCQSCVLDELSKKVSKNREKREREEGEKRRREE